MDTEDTWRQLKELAWALFDADADDPLPWFLDTGSNLNDNDELNELLDTGSVTVRLGGRAYVLQLMATPEKAP
jgi:hypothetical protein